MNAHFQQAREMGQRFNIVCCRFFVFLRIQQVSSDEEKRKMKRKCNDRAHKCQTETRENDEVFRNDEFFDI